MTRCFIIGNGPSLREHDLTKLKNEVTFGCNRIYMLREEMGFSVTYYFCLDSIMPALLHVDIKEYIDSEDVKKAFILSPYSSLYAGIKKVEFSGSSYSVGIDMIKKAVELGYKPIYMLGCDMDYHHPEQADRKTLLSIDEFPVSQRIKDALHEAGRAVNMKCVFLSDKDDISHFSVDYDRGIPTQYEPPGDMLMGKFKQAVGKIDGLYNAGIGGKCDFLPRVDYDSLFDGGHT